MNNLSQWTARRKKKPCGKKTVPIWFFSPTREISRDSLHAGVSFVPRCRCHHQEGNSLPPSPHDRLIATIDDVSTGMIVERPRATEFQSPTGSRVSSKIGQRFGGIAFPLAQAPARLKDAGRGGEAKTTSLPPVQVKPRRRRLRYGMACLASSEAGTPPPRTPPPLPPRSQLLCPSSPLPLFHNTTYMTIAADTASAGLFGFVSTDGRLDGGR